MPLRRARQICFGNVRAIDRKLLRDILHLKGQIIATTLVVMCGVASFVSMRTTYSSLLDTQQEYYALYRFANVFAHLTRAPVSLHNELEGIPGVAAAREQNRQGPCRTRRASASFSFAYVVRQTATAAHCPRRSPPQRRTSEGSEDSRIAETSSTRTPPSAVD